MKRQMTGFALLAVTAVAAGCGGDDDEGLSKADYVKQGNAICKEFEGKVGKDAETAFAGLESENDLTADAAREFFDAALPKFDAAVEELDALEPPKDDEDAVQAMIDAGKSDSKKIEDAKDDDKAITGFVLNESATPEFDQKVEAYGLAECGTEN